MDDVLGTVNPDPPNHCPGQLPCAGDDEVTDTHPLYEDRAYGGAGLDILFGNTVGDRLIDWVGEFNSFIVPVAIFGIPQVSRQVSPFVPEFLYGLSASDGADPTRDTDTGNSADRNGEPDGELGLVTQRDHGLWQDQTGGPTDPQPGNVPGGRRDVLRSADFNDGSMSSFAVDSGAWQVNQGRLDVSAESLGGDAAAVFYHNSYLPNYYEIKAIVRTDKPIQGWKSNAYVFFDYYSPTDFKFAGINASTDKIQMGRRTPEGWIVDVQSPSQIKPGRDYEMLVAVNGTTVTVVVDNNDYFTHVFDPRVIDGWSVGLNTGLVGVGSDNARGSFDNVTVQVLPPEFTLQETETFEDGTAERFTGATTGTWKIVAEDRYEGTPTAGEDAAINLMDLGARLQFSSYLELATTLRTDSIAGLVFDRYADDDFKSAAIDVGANEVIIGHHSPNRGWVVDTTVSQPLVASKDHALRISLRGASVSVMLNGQLIAGWGFNSAVVDGGFGLLTRDGTSSFDHVTVRTNDPAVATSDQGPAPVGLSSFGDTYFEDFSGLGAIGSLMPEGWSANTSGIVNTTITDVFPTATVVGGTYNAGSGDDRTLATGNIDSSVSNSLQLRAQLTGPNDVWAVVFQTRIEAWFGDAVIADNPGEAAVLVSLEFDPEKDGTYQTAETFNGGAPITTGVGLSPAALDGNGAAGTEFSSGLVLLPTSIPAGSDIRLTFDAQGVGQTTGYIFGVDDVLLRIVAPGDTDGNGAVDSSDLFNILAAGKFNHPELGPATWGEGDFTGDTLVNSSDLFAMLASGQFNSGPYASEPTAATVDTSSAEVTSGGDALVEGQQASQLLSAQLDSQSSTASTNVTTLDSSLVDSPTDRRRQFIERSIQSTTSLTDRSVIDERLLLANQFASMTNSFMAGDAPRTPSTSQALFGTEDLPEVAVQRPTEVNPLSNGRRAFVDSIFDELGDVRAGTNGHRRRLGLERESITVRRGDRDHSWAESVDIALDEEWISLDGGESPSGKKG